MSEFNKESRNRAVVSDELAAQVTGGDGSEVEIHTGECAICQGDHDSSVCPDSKEEEFMVNGNLYPWINDQELQLIL